jgi:hypothetical protein
LREYSLDSSPAPEALVPSGSGSSGGPLANRHTARRSRIWLGRTKRRSPKNVKIAGLVAFYNERADFIVDGERQTRPKTKFS